jgi:hypothetical protein
VLNSFDLVAEFQNITELKKDLHINPYEMIILENNAFEKILEILIPKFEKEKLKMRRFSAWEIHSSCFTKMVRALERFMNKPDEIDSDNFNKIYRKVLLGDVDNALGVAEMFLKKFVNKYPVNPKKMRKLSKLECCQLAHHALTHFITSKHFDEISHMANYTTFPQGS